ncbi:pseudouridine synthase [Lysobacter sp. H21R4]|uniref:pseudouridine synthase n=1 Tax=Lysobacter sp. H21R4 TaxID=2781021 RepID=UPI001888B7A7|nr:pseudouridine synthase [Lysobacter sp. H21R4]QOY61733.1 pseudouridine synthase [Lysobacter sp. H21R4]
MKPRPTPVDGVPASRVQLPGGTWPSAFDAMCARFPRIDKATWRSRFARGRVLDDAGLPLAADASVTAGMTLYYYREVVEEPAIPFTGQVLHADADLLVVDKPHFLPVMPAGAYVRESLLFRLQQTLKNADIVPLHRIDRGTAGLVMFSVNPATRDAYQALFRDRAIGKHYEALAPALPATRFPLVHRSHLQRGEPFFRMREVPGDANSESRIDVLDRDGDVWRYALEPVTGKKHQLRVHMTALGAPIINDPFYPDLLEQSADKHALPLKLLARSLAFIDPLTGDAREFRSALALELPEPISAA